jgi:hypothetical protein
MDKTMQHNKGQKRIGQFDLYYGVESLSKLRIICEQKSLNNHFGTLMKKLSNLFFAATFGLISFASFAQSSTINQIGNMLYQNDINGNSNTYNKIGNTTYRNGSDGSSSTYNQIGNTTYRTDSDGNSGTYNRIGNTTYRNDSNGYSTTSNTIGNTTYTTDSNGKMRTCTNIGSYITCH